jgi:hypothetical protein
LGKGEPTLVWVPGWISNVQLYDDPTMPFALIVEQLSTGMRLVVWDKRGTGLPDPVNRPPPLDERMTDLRAVLEAAGADRPARSARVHHPRHHRGISEVSGSLDLAHPAFRRSLSHRLPTERGPTRRGAGPVSSDGQTITDQGTAQKEPRPVGESPDTGFSDVDDSST